ncbi:hypothetical protein Tco_0589866 [Tanacetum coccineum]
MSKGNMSTREVRATVANELKKRWRKGQALVGLFGGSLVAALIALARIAENAKRSHKLNANRQSQFVITHLSKAFTIELPSADSIVVRRTLSDLTDNPSSLQGLDHSSMMLIFSQRNAKPCTEVITRVTGPEIGNLTTPIFLVQLILLKQRQDLPKGGVYHLGIIFGLADLQDRLQEKIEFLLI